MREHPVLFKGELVRAILEGRKTQTRRPVTPFTSLLDGVEHMNRPRWTGLDFSDAFVDPGPSPAGNPGPYLKVARPAEDSRHRVYPRWCEGDRLWVRETWAAEMLGHNTACFSLQYQATPTAKERGRPVMPPASFALKRQCAGPTGWADGVWRPSIHMPRWASRLTLEITGVRVERLQDISEADARAEGVKPLQMDGGSCLPSFEGLWDCAYAKRAPWSSSPWVWAISFRRLHAG